MKQKKLCRRDEVHVEVRCDGGEGPGFILLLKKCMGGGNSYYIAEHVAWMVDNMPRWGERERVVWTMCNEIGGILVRGKRHIRITPTGKKRILHNITFPGGGSAIGLTPKKPFICEVGLQSLVEPRLFVERRLRRRNGAARTA